MRRGHCQRGWKVEAQLEDLQLATSLHKTLRCKLGTYDATRGHPLHATCIDDAFVAAGVRVCETAIQHKCHRLETPVRMRTKRKPSVTRRVDLRTVMVKKNKPLQIR
jgi:hypothetical protein